jgi:RimJ/RimL family protein N-acetyltransferase
MGQTTVIVTELDRCDFPTIREWIDPNLFRRFRTPITDEQLEGLLTRRRDGRLTDLGLKAADDTGQALGLVHVVFEWNNDLGHIRTILVKPASRRQGVGGALIRHTLRACFEEHRLHRAQLFVEQDNGPAVAFYRKMGFHADGLMRDAWKIGDRYISWYCMSMLQSEWEGHI